MLYKSKQQSYDYIVKSFHEIDLPPFVGSDTPRYDSVFSLLLNENNVMKVAFWNGTDKVGNVTGYLAAISVYCTLYYEKCVIAGSNYLGGQGLEDYFFPNPEKTGIERAQKRYPFGEPGYFRNLWEKRMAEDRKTGDITTHAGIRLVQPPDGLESRMFYRNVSRETLYFMDISGKINAFSLQALEEADIVAVFLPQNEMEIQKFFHQYSSIIPKSVFFITDYHSKESCNSHYLHRIYGIDRRRLGVLPACIKFDMACETGDVERFFQESEEGEKCFCRNIRRAVELLLAAENEEEQSKGKYEISE